jgi:ABC-type polysaccharide/polyol phosphate transport system ATPase subunit
MPICYKEIDMKAVEIKNLRKEYNLYRKPIHRLWETLLPFKKNKFHKSFLALDDVSFAIDKGECFGIIGENGAGKSTILKIITGVLAQSSGEVIIDGTISALLELGAGFNLEYTGLENIYMNALVYGISKEEMNKRLPSILEFADIGEFIYQPVKLYSSGMFARLAFALQISFDPDILIVDEALAVGDIFFQAKCYKKFEEFNRKFKVGDVSQEVFNFVAFPTIIGTMIVPKADATDAKKYISKLTSDITKKYKGVINKAQFVSQEVGDKAYFAIGLTDKLTSKVADKAKDGKKVFDKANFKL